MDYWIWFANIEKLGAIRKYKILREFQTVENFYNANKREILSIDGFGEETWKNILKSKNSEVIYKQEEFMKRNNINYINFYEEGYPKLLKEIYDPPVTIFYKGDLKTLNQDCISVIGSRNASDYGIRNAYNISKAIVSKGYCVVSGLAKGIDSYAHKGAIDGGGKTIAVLGCGIDVIYPKENLNLYKGVCQNGVLISEYPVGEKPKADNFPMRNRIISGLSQKVIVVEAAEKSGTLITVETALEQGREILAVPRQYKFKLKCWN